MNNFNFLQAKETLEAISAVAANESNKFIAGGTNLVDLLKYNLAVADTLVDLNRLEDYHTIVLKENGNLWIGALVSNAETAYHPMVEAHFPLLSKAILAGASAQIRNMATNGGNLLQRTRCYYFYDSAVPCNKRKPGSGCSAIGGYNRMMAILGTSDQCIAVFPSDMCVALAALNAVVHISNGEGFRSIPFAEFHRLPGDTPHIDNNLLHGELITGIEIPAQGFSNNYSYLKLRDRNSYAFALVSVAAAFELENGLIKEARIALGGVAHKPWRVVEAEEQLTGKLPAPESFAAAAELILADARGFEHNSFKIELAKRAIIRNCMMALDPSSQLPGAQPSA